MFFKEDIDELKAEPQSLLLITDGQNAPFA